jgi:methionine-rich copper-binding protein CopC
MSDITTRRGIRLAGLAGALLLTFLLPATASAHAELETSTPSDGSTVSDGPLADPIVLTFSAALADGSGADLRDSAGVVPASDGVQGDTITITPEAPLGEGVYAVEWTSIADDGDILRGTVRFTVVVPATPEPTATASATPTASASAEPSATASPTPVPSSSAAPVDPDTSAGAGDVLLPIVLGAVLIGALAVFLLRRRDSSKTP